MWQADKKTWAGARREAHVVGDRREQALCVRARRARGTWVVGHRHEQALRV